MQVNRRFGLSVVAGHGRWSCDVVAMVKGGWDVVWLLRVALVTYGSSVTAGMLTVREEGAGLFDHPSLSRHNPSFYFTLMTVTVIMF